jgi:hypothetical protein
VLDRGQFPAGSHTATVASTSGNRPAMGQLPLVL